MYKNDRVTRRYSEPFKLKILAELSTGKYTKSQLGKLYRKKLKALVSFKLYIKNVAIVCANHS